MLYTTFVYHFYDVAFDSTTLFKLTYQVHVFTVIVRDNRRMCGAMFTDSEMRSVQVSSDYTGRLATAVNTTGITTVE